MASLTPRPPAPAAYKALRMPHHQKARKRALIAGGVTLLLGARSAWLGRRALRLLREQAPLHNRLMHEKGLAEGAKNALKGKLRNMRTQRHAAASGSKRWRNAAIWSVPVGATAALLPLAQYQGFKTHAKYVDPIRLDEVVIHPYGPMQIESKQAIQDRENYARGKKWMDYRRTKGMGTGSKMTPEHIIALGEKLTPAEIKSAETALAFTKSKNLYKGPLSRKWAHREYKWLENEAKEVMPKLTERYKKTEFFRKYNTPMTLEWRAIEQSKLPIDKKAKAMRAHTDKYQKLEDAWMKAPVKSSTLKTWYLNEKRREKKDMLHNIHAHQTYLLYGDSKKDKRTQADNSVFQRVRQAL